MSNTFALPSYPRTWLDTEAPLETWEQIAPWYEKLQNWSPQSSEEFAQWLRARDELDAAVNEVGDRRYVAMTCQTDDESKSQAYLDFVRTIEPELKRVRNALRTAYLDHPLRASLPAEQYAIFDRDEQTRRDLFRPENVEREQELAELGQRYQEIDGAMTVTYRGEEKTTKQMVPFLEQTDRAVREETWRLVQQRRLEDRERLDDLFDRMVVLRHQIAQASGYETYVPYIYREKLRFDYQPEDAYRFHEAIETHVVPLARRLNDQRRVLLGVDPLRPWDLAVDPRNREPLRPFDDVERLAEGTETILRGIDPELSAQFAALSQAGQLDLGNRKGKAPGGYQTTFEEQRIPFIFMNAVGLDDDVRTLLHEAGHAFHSLAARDLEPSAYRHAPIEFCEVASMAMELLAAERLAVFYDEEGTRRSYCQLLEGIVGVLPWIASVDAFQHQLYLEPDHDRQRRRAIWLEIVDRFGARVDWSGLEEFKANTWQRQLHIFLHPFYYIEYGIAQLGALQVWLRSREDFPGAVQSYRSALTLGGSKPLPELFAAAGVRFDFQAETIAPLVAAIDEELQRLEDA